MTQQHTTHHPMIQQHTTHQPMTQQHTTHHPMTQQHTTQQITTIWTNKKRPVQNTIKKKLNNKN
jgi:hypothetical protein